MTIQSAFDHVLAIDLGTSRVKVGIINQSLVAIADAVRPLDTIATTWGMAEQRTDDWLEAIREAATDVLVQIGDPSLVSAVALTAQMPTLVELTADSAVRANAVTWQDSRADQLVRDRLDEASRQRVDDVTGAPIDGRYLVPMHLRRNHEPSASRILSAKDYLFARLTGDFVTDPSTASGFGVFDLARNRWSQSLCDLWGVTTDLLPTIEPSSHAVALSTRGATLLPGVATGVPVYLGGADSVCAHHYINSLLPGALSIIDGSSTVLLAKEGQMSYSPHRVLRTPLIEPRSIGVEMDLLATGSSIGWLAKLLDVAPGDIEQLALSHRSPEESTVLFSPYLAGGEQGVLWREDLSGTVSGLTLATEREDLALALFEGIAFETVCCVRHFDTLTDGRDIVSIGARDNQHFGASLVSSLLGRPVVTLDSQSPSLLGAALLAFTAMGAHVESDSTSLVVPPTLAGRYVDSLARKMADYVAAPFSAHQRSQS
ncbi:MAG: xylulokinase [Acidimicrobiales bacterium]